MRNDRVGLRADEPTLQAVDRERWVEHDALDVVGGQANAQVFLERGEVQRQRRHHLPLGRRGSHHVFLEGLDERHPIGRRHGGQ